jgi:hypothetical protein
VVYLSIVDCLDGTIARLVSCWLWLRAVLELEACFGYEVYSAQLGVDILLFYLIKMNGWTPVTMIGNRFESILFGCRYRVGSSILDLFGWRSNSYC